MQGRLGRLSVFWADECSFSLLPAGIAFYFLGASLSITGMSQNRVFLSPAQVVIGANAHDGFVF